MDVSLLRWWQFHLACLAKSKFQVRIFQEFLFAVNAALLVLQISGTS